MPPRAQYDQPQRSYLAMEFHRRKGIRDFLPGLLADFAAQLYAGRGKGDVNRADANGKQYDFEKPTKLPNEWSKNICQYGKTGASLIRQGSMSTSKF